MITNFFSFVLAGECYVAHATSVMRVLHPCAVLPKTSISPLKAVCRRFMELSYQNQFHVYYSNTSVRPKLQYEIRFYAVNNVMLTVFFWLLCAFFSRISRGKYVFYIICWFPRLFENFLCNIVNILPDLDILYAKGFIYV